jgi:hypothetical protein
VEAGETARSNQFNLTLPEREWRELVEKLCQSARLILILPLIDIDLSEPRPPLNDFSAPTPGVERILAERKRRGLEYELALVASQSLLQKTVFVIPNSLSVEELAVIEERLERVLVRLPATRPLPFANNLNLYHCTSPGAEAVGVTGAVESGRLSRVFRTITEPDSLLRGNPFEYLLASDVEKRHKRFRTRYTL